MPFIRIGTELINLDRFDRVSIDYDRRIIKFIKIKYSGNGPAKKTTSGHPNTPFGSMTIVSEPNKQTEISMIFKIDSKREITKIERKIMRLQNGGME